MQWAHPENKRPKDFRYAPVRIVPDGSAQIQRQTDPLPLLARASRVCRGNPDDAYRRKDMRTLRVASVAAICGLTLMASSTQATDKPKEKPDATIRLSAGSVAVGLGYSWGSGELRYKGKKYPFSIDGVSVGDVGVTKAEATGSVYHLHKLEDFNGNYTAASAGATLGGGGGASAMKNQNGVEINLVSTTRGLKLKLAVDGVKIQLKK